MTIFGTELSDGVYNASTSPLPTQLGPTSVTVNGTAAHLFYASPAQINFHMPSDIDLSNVNVVVHNQAPAGAQLATDPQALAAFAEKAGLRDVSGFVETVQSLRATGHLPPRYISKEQAAVHGWHGGGLCTIWPGHAIGGDVFTNAGHPLPRRIYREADLDETCNSRGPKRLIFADDPAAVERLEAEIGHKQAEAVDSIIEQSQSCWRGYVQPYVGGEGTADERRKSLRAAWRAKGWPTPVPPTTGQ